MIDTIYKKIGCDEQSDDEILYNWNNKEINIKDGTKVKLILEDCFNSKLEDEHIYLYYIEILELYICAKCLLRQKYHSNIYNEFKKDEEYMQMFLLPIQWDNNTIRSYIIKNINGNKKLEEDIKSGDFKYVF